MKISQQTNPRISDFNLPCNVTIMSRIHGELLLIAIWILYLIEGTMLSTLLRCEWLNNNEYDYDK